MEGTMTKDGDDVIVLSALTDGNVIQSATATSDTLTLGKDTEPLADIMDKDSLSDVSDDTMPESPCGIVNGTEEVVEKDCSGDAAEPVSTLSKSVEDVNEVNIDETDGAVKEKEDLPVESVSDADKSAGVEDSDDVELIRDSPPPSVEKEKATEEATEEAMDESNIEDKTVDEKSDSKEPPNETAIPLEDDVSKIVDTDIPESSPKCSAVETTNENGILEIVSITTSAQEESDKDLEEMDLVIQNVTGSVDLVDKPNEDESDSNKKRRKEGRDSESDDENQEGMIRLRDFSTLKEKSDDDDDDDDVVMLSPPKKTHFVKAQDLSVADADKVMDLNMESGPGLPDSRIKKEIEANRVKTGMARRQLSYLSQQLTIRNGVITLRLPTNGAVGSTNTQIRKTTPGFIQLQPNMSSHQQSNNSSLQQQPIVSTANRPVPALRPTSMPTVTPSGMIQIGDRLVGRPTASNTFATLRRNDPILRPGATPGTLQMSISNVRTASELYQQQRVASYGAQGNVSTYRMAGPPVSSTSFATPTQTVNSRNQIIYNSNSGSFVTPVHPTTRVYSGVINNTPTPDNLQYQQSLRLAPLASVTSQIMSSGRVSRMQLSNTDAPHLTATVMNGPPGSTPSMSTTDMGGAVQAFVLDKATGNMISLSSYQDLTRAVITQRPQGTPNTSQVLRPRGMRLQTPLLPSPASVAASITAQNQLISNASPRTASAVAVRGRFRSRTPANNSTPPRAPQQSPQNGLPIILPKPASSGSSGTTALNTNGTSTLPPGDGGEKELSNKTFPSLVVTVKPCLQERAPKTVLTASRVDLDARVKTILMYSPSKFTEYLMQQGLVRLDQKCPSHPEAACKLGMYSDGGKKHPFSGGYVWIPECCADKQVSVFTGSIFEASVYPPGTLMKLIYHWACQTPAASVLQWVKVTSYYLKNFCTLLRSACVAGLHEHAVTMGGKGKYVEIGIITLGTTVSAQSGSSKQVKIEILGVFDPASKFIRMKVLNQDEKGGGDRISQILWPLHAWVNKQSFILIDSSMDKSLLEGMGFTHVSQRPSNNAKISSTVPTNVNVMNYLKNIVPKMFQNTLCVLSKSLIQQFLDELSWREVWGSTPSKCFDTLLLHLIEMTRADTGETLISRLNRISLNPFSEWSYTPKSNLNNFENRDMPVATGVTPPSTSANSARETSSALSALDSLGELAATFMGHHKATGAAKRKSSVLGDDSSSGSLLDGRDLHRLATSGAKMYTVQSYYYAWISPGIVEGRPAFPNGLKCPMCSKQLMNNLDSMRHLMQHVVYVDRPVFAHQIVCLYCLKEVPSGSSLQQHVEDKHKLAEAQYACRICCLKFGRENDLIVHMWTHHVEAETPYKCELCSYKSSFHFDVVDHFIQMHRDIDSTQCPVCLKTMSVRGLGDLKLIVLHLQNHVTRKSKKCQDCVLSFHDHKELTHHILSDQSHSSQAEHTSFKRHKVIGIPIGMAKPPPVNRTDRIPPPPPPKKSKSGGSVKPGVKTLNSAIAIPINPNEKFTYDRFTMRITDFSKKKCWECNADLSPTHLTGRLKCNKCRYVTSCPAAMAEHTKLHPNSSSAAPPPPQYLKLPSSLKAFLKSEGPVSCTNCNTSFDFPDLLVQHMVTVCKQKSCKVSPVDETSETTVPPVPAPTS